LVLKLGTGHGAFYRPGDWIERVVGMGEAGERLWSVTRTIKK
jgi:hypothetical protein